MSDEDRERVRDASEIIQVIGDHVALKSRGKEFLGRCPFHDDHRPSMYVVPHKGIFHCFVCGAGGDVFSFVQQFHGMDFREALEFLAERANVTLKQGYQASESGGVSRKSLFEANEAACQFFQSNLTRSPGTRAYLAGRTVNDASINSFRLGFAPNSWTALETALSTKIPVEILESAGLLNRNDQGNYYSPFKNRLMIPLMDAQGRIVGFAGRALDPNEEIKYFNTHETEIYKKSKVLFGLEKALRSIQERGKAYVFEGYMDVILAHQHNMRNTVCTGGTAFTTKHADLLYKRCGSLPITFCFDGDEAGVKAAMRATKHTFGRINNLVALLSPESDDPATVLASGGNLEALLAPNTRPAFEFYVTQLMKGKNIETPEGRLALLDEIKEPLTELPPRATALYLEVLAQVTRIPQRTIEYTLFGASALEGSRARIEQEKYLIRCLVAYPEKPLMDHIKKTELRPSHFKLPEARAFYRWMTQQSQEQLALLQAVEAPLFRITELPGVLGEIYASSSQENPLDKEVLRSLINIGYLNGRRPKLEELEYTARAIRVYAGADKLIKHSNNPPAWVRMFLKRLERGDDEAPYN